MAFIVRKGPDDKRKSEVVTRDKALRLQAILNGTVEGTPEEQAEAVSITGFYFARQTVVEQPLKRATTLTSVQEQMRPDPADVINDRYR